MIIDLAKVFASADRREFLCRHVPRCLACGSEQVQLLDHEREPALWRCRSCKLYLSFEPHAPPKVTVAEFQEVVSLVAQLGFNRMFP